MISEDFCWSLIFGWNNTLLLCSILYLLNTSRPVGLKAYSDFVHSTKFPLFVPWKIQPRQVSDISRIMFLTPHTSSIHLNIFTLSADEWHFSNSHLSMIFKILASSSSHGGWCFRVLFNSPLLLCRKLYEYGKFVVVPAKMASKSLAYQTP